MQLRLNGTPCVVDQGETTYLSEREAALLAWLHLEGPTPRGGLAGRLWPLGDDAKARANLRQLLSRLRRAVGPLVDEHQGLMRLADDVEVVQFPARLLGAVEFDDAPELADWLDGQREAQRRTHLRVGLSRARDAVAAGRFDEVLAAADEVLMVDPASEEAHRLRMQTFWQRGDRAAALQAWDDCRLALRQQFGVPPSSETNKLGQRILMSEAAAEASHRSTDLPNAILHPTVFVGRELETQQLTEALLRGAGVVVHGIAGIGKSRLMRQAAELIQPSVWVTGRSGDEDTSGATIARLITRAMEQFTPQLDAQTRADLHRLLPGSRIGVKQVHSASAYQRMVASASRVLIGCYARGLRLVVIDDVQFADDLSISAIAALADGWAKEPPGQSFTILLGRRSHELREPARKLLALLERSERCVQINLQPVGLEALTQLVDQAPLPPVFEGKRVQLAKLLHARLGGVPAHWVESLKSLWRSPPDQWEPAGPLQLPGTIAAQVSQRLQQLSPSALQLAQLAAVAQRDFSLALAADALARPPLALSPLFVELEAAYVLNSGVFAHDLVAEAVQASVPSSLRAPLHRLIADHLRKHDGEPAAVARHFQAAGSTRLAGEWHQIAAQRALAQWRHADAARHFELAAECLGVESPEADRAARVACLREAGRSRMVLSQPVEADRLLESAYALAQPGGEQLGVICARVPVWSATAKSGKVREALHTLVHALENPPVDLAPATRDTIWRVVSIAGLYTRLAHRILALPVGFKSAHGAATAVELAARGQLMFATGDHKSAIAILAPSVAQVVRDGIRSPDAFNAAQMWAEAALRLGDLSGTDDALSALSVLCDRLSVGPLLQMGVKRYKALRLLALARPDEALLEVNQIYKEFETLKLDRFDLDLYWLLEATALAALGNHAGAMQIVEQGVSQRRVEWGVSYEFNWAARLGCQLSVKLRLPTEPWLELLRQADPNWVNDAPSLEADCIMALCGLRSLDSVWESAKLRGRIPLGHVLGQLMAPDALRDPWLYPI